MIELNVFIVLYSTGSHIMASKFCPVCQRNIALQIIDGTTITFPCHCHFVKAADEKHALLWEEVAHVNDDNSRYSKFIANAPFDVTNTIVKKDCEKCGRNYMTQLLLDDNAKVIYVCKCQGGSEHK